MRRRFERAELKRRGRQALGAHDHRLAQNRQIALEHIEFERLAARRRARRMERDVEPRRTRREGPERTRFDAQPASAAETDARLLDRRRLQPVQGPGRADEVPGEPVPLPRLAVLGCSITVMSHHRHVERRVMGHARVARRRRRRAEVLLPRGAVPVPAVAEYSPVAAAEQDHHRAGRLHHRVLDSPDEPRRRPLGDPERHGAEIHQEPGVVRACRRGRCPPKNTSGQPACQAPPSRRREVRDHRASSAPTPSRHSNGRTATRRCAAARSSAAAEPVATRLVARERGEQARRCRRRRLHEATW
jgi:hypothetical protein